MTSATKMAHWDKQANSWNKIGAPLRPCHLDIDNLTIWINKLSRELKKPLQVLLLGVTPEIVRIKWPDETSLISIDNNLSMLKNVLPRDDIYPTPKTSCANWLSLPFKSGSFDAVLGDGCYSSLIKNNYAVLTKEIKRTLKAHGVLLMRFFLGKDTMTLDKLKHHTLQGKIKTFHEFKLKLAMCVQNNFSNPVSLNTVWEVWHSQFKDDVAPLWPRDIVNTINNYKNSDAVYTFPILDEVRDILKNYFVEDDVFYPSYSMGDQCPTIKFCVS